MQGAEQPAVAHAVRDHVHLFGAAVLSEVQEKIRDRLLAPLDARFVGGVGGDAAAGGPTEERRGARHLEVASNLRGADGRVLERHVVAMQEEQGVRRLAILARGRGGCVDFRKECIPL